MNEQCAKCGGACCRVLVIPARDHAEREWIEGRAIMMTDSQAVIESRCRHLSEDGRCLVQDNKPLYCKLAEVNDAICKLCMVAKGNALTKSPDSAKTS